MTTNIIIITVELREMEQTRKTNQRPSSLAVSTVSATASDKHAKDHDNLSESDMRTNSKSRPKPGNTKTASKTSSLNNSDAKSVAKSGNTKKSVGTKKSDSTKKSDEKPDVKSGGSKSAGTKTGGSKSAGSKSAGTKSGTKPLVRTLQRRPNLNDDDDDDDDDEIDGNSGDKMDLDVEKPPTRESSLPIITKSNKRKPSDEVNKKPAKKQASRRKGQKTSPVVISDSDEFLADDHVKPHVTKRTARVSPSSTVGSPDPKTP